MSQVRRSSEVRQVELVDAALQIIGTEGVAVLTTRRLAEAVGLSSGAIFRHFASLDALLAAVVTRAEEVLEEAYPPAELEPAARLARFVESRSVAVGRQLGVLRLVLSEQFHLALPAEASARLARCVGRTREFVVRTLREGQRAGVFRADLEAGALAVIVMGTTQMLAWSARRGRQVEEARAARAALFVVLQPTLTKAGASPRKKRSTS